MGNCQAVDAAVLVIQHPCGKIDRLYWPVTASEVMKTNPGHYVSLIIPLPVLPEEQNQEQKTVKFTRVKLLRPNETLNLGHAYRLITNQGIYMFLSLRTCNHICEIFVLSLFFVFVVLEVMKVLKAKKHAKSKKTQEDAVLPGYETKKGEESDQGNTYQVYLIFYDINSPFLP